MKLLLAERARLGKFHPRHFERLAQALGADRLTWISKLNQVAAGEDWALVVRAPSSHSLNADPETRRPGVPLVFENITGAERKALEKRGGRLLFDMGWEPLFPRDEIIKGLRHGLIECGVEPACVRILHSNVQADAAFDARWRAAFPEPPPVSLGFPVGFAVGAVYQTGSANSEAIRARLQRALAAMDQPKPKTFNSFNGEARPHRVAFLAYLEALGLLDGAYVSLLAYKKNLSEGAAARTVTENVERIMRTTAHSEATLAVLPDLLKRLPILLDVESNEPPTPQKLEVLAWESQPQHFYDESWFSVVFDTLFAELDMLFLTEKLMKPILNASPFVYLGNGGVEHELEKLGFQTFAPQIDQSYLAQRKPGARFAAVLEEVGRLARLDRVTLAEQMNALRPQITHNYNHFWHGLIPVLRRRFHAEVLDRL